MKTRSGFTLVEVLVVLVIVGAGSVADDTSFPPTLRELRAETAR